MLNRWVTVKDFTTRIFTGLFEAKMSSRYTLPVSCLHIPLNHRNIFDHIPICSAAGPAHDQHLLRVPIQQGVSLKELTPASYVQRHCGWTRRRLSRYIRVSRTRSRSFRDGTVSIKEEADWHRLTPEIGVNLGRASWLHDTRKFNGLDCDFSS